MVAGAADGGARGRQGPVPGTLRRGAARPDGAQPPWSSARVPRGPGDLWRPRPPPPATAASAAGSVGSESQVFEGRGVVVQRDADHALVGELLDPVKQRLALPAV